MYFNYKHTIYAQAVHDKTRALTAPHCICTPLTIICTLCFNHRSSYTCDVPTQLHYYVILIEQQKNQIRAASTIHTVWQKLKCVTYMDGQMGGTHCHNSHQLQSKCPVYLAITVINPLLQTISSTWYSVLFKGSIP